MSNHYRANVKQDKKTLRYFYHTWNRAYKYLNFPFLISLCCFNDLVGQYESNANISSILSFHVRGQQIEYLCI